MYYVLIADDEPMVKIALKTLLDWESIGFSICASASDGEEALRLTEQYHPDIIITDLKMPVMDGLELIQALASRHYPGKILVLSNYGDYSYVRQALKSGAVDYILKVSLNKSELTEQLLHCTHLIESSHEVKKNLQAPSISGLVLKNYLTDPLYTYEELCACCPLEDTSYYVCYLSHPSMAEFINQNNKKIPSSSVRSILLENFRFLSEKSLIQTGPCCFALLIPCHILDNIELSPSDFARQIIDYFQQFLAMPLLVCISAAPCPPAELKARYEDCATARFQYFYGYRPPYHPEDVCIRHYLNFKDYRTFASEVLEDYLKKGIVKDIEPFDSFLKKCKNETIHPELVKEYLIKMCTYIDIALHTDLMDGKSDLQSALESSCSITLLGENMYSFFSQAGQALIDDISLYKKEVVRSIQYIREHYYEKITLESIAASIGISVNYLCKIFKENTGMSIIHYLNSYRMEKASCLILQSGLYLKDIAESVGISDQFYFNRIFKKHFGTTPSAYKAEHTRNSGETK